MDNLLIIGGSDAGISAALRAREMAPSCGVTVMLADDYPNYSICGLPFFLSGEIPDWRSLAHRTREELLRQSLRLLPSHKATAIRPEEKIVVASSSSGEKTFSYDRLILATGAASRKPRHIKGLDTPGVFFLRWMADSFAIAQHIERTAPTSVLIIGSGYIGLEMADALTRRGLAVTLVGHSQHVLKTVDPALGRLVVAELERNSVRVVSGVSVEEIGARNGRLVAFGPGGFQAQADLILVATGAEPEVGLAKSGEVPLGYGGAIKVNRRMETGVPGIFAAGDCVETWHRLLEKSVYLPLGTTAHKQGRLAGENALGGEQRICRHVRDAGVETLRFGHRAYRIKRCRGSVGRILVLRRPTWNSHDEEVPERGGN